MSANTIVPFITKNYGLADEDLDVIIPRENLKDISDKFLSSIKSTQNKFVTDIRIRVLQFDNNSGSDYSGRMMFNQLISAQKTVFYNHLFSNRDCCVFFIYAGHRMDNTNFFEDRIVPHEFAHHYQFVTGFPCLLPNGCPPIYYPEFSDVKLIGPLTGDVYVDGLLVNDCRISYFKDFSERIGDFVCESILMEKGFTRGLSDEYIDICQNDLTKALPKSTPNYAHAMRYLYRLGLRDEAEWHELLSRIYSNDSELKIKMEYHLNKILKLNKELEGRKQIFRKLVDLTAKIEYVEFKNADYAIDYIKEVSRLLNIQIKSKDKW